MATTFFPVVDASTLSSSSWTSAAPTYKKLLLTRGAGVQSITDNTASGLGVDPIGNLSQVSTWGAGGTTYSLVAGTETWLSASPTIWVTNPLDAVTVAGTITVNIRALESNAMANYGVCAFVYRVPVGGGAAVRIGRADLNTELGTTEAARSVSITPTSTALSAGDSLATVFAWFAAGGASASTFTVTGFYAGASGLTGDTFLTFTETITEQSVPAAFQPRHPVANLTTSPGLV